MSVLKEFLEGMDEMQYLCMAVRVMSRGCVERLQVHVCVCSGMNRS